MISVSTKSFAVEAFDVAIDKGTIDAVLTDVETSDIEKLPENIRSLLGGISKVTKTCFILISHDKDRKFLLNSTL